MIFTLPVDGLDETDVVLLAEMFDRQSGIGPDAWRAVMAELSDGFRSALAGRRVADARFDADPLGAVWYPR